MKRNLYWLATLMLLIAALAFAWGTALADVEGDFTYVIRDNGATVTGYTGSDSWVSFPETLGGYPVTAIGDRAFENSILSNVWLPDTVRYIGSGSFMNSTNLRQIELPAYMDGLEDAFSGCTSLTSITLPKNLTRISCGMFMNCSSLVSIDIPAPVTYIDEIAFKNCTSLTTVKICGVNTEIDATAFEGCSSDLTLLVKENSAALELAGEYSLNYRIIGDFDYELTNDNTEVSVTGYTGTATALVIPETLEGLPVTAISDYAFQNCAFDSAVIPETVRSIGYGVFSKCKSLTHIELPASMEYLDGAFGGCTSLVSITLPQNIKQLSCDIFRDCSSLISIDIPAAVTYIDEDAFTNCTSLTTVKINNAATEIDSCAFSGCSSSLKLIVPANSAALTFAINHGIAYEIDGASPTDPGVIASGTCGENAAWTLDQNGLLTISGTGAMTDYSNPFDPQWYAEDMYMDITSIVIEPGITHVGAYAFTGCNNVRSLSLPEGLISIGDCAFAANGITELHLPSTLTSLGISCFDTMSNLTEVTIPGSIQVLPVQLFMGSEGLQRVTLLDGVTTISENAFIDCGQLESITIPASVTLIDDTAFRRCTSLANVYYAGTEEQWSAISVGGEGNETLTSAILHCNYSSAEIIDSGSYGNNVTWTLNSDGVLTLSGTGEMQDSTPGDRPWGFSGDDWMFDRITSIIIEPGITHIGDCAFMAHYNVRSLSLPEGLVSIGDNAFSGAMITELHLPSTVTELGEGCFDSASITEVTIPGSVGEVSRMLFMSCESLKCVTLSNGTTIIRDNAFQGCENLESITLPSSVTTIEENAFTGCSSLTDVYYTGTEEQWNAITIREVGNEALNSAQIHYNYSPTAPIASGTCGDNLTWTLTSDGALTVRGTGEMYDYELEGAPWFMSDTSLITSIIIEPGVTRVGNCAFAGCNYVRSLSLPDGLLSIGDSAFGSFRNVTELHLPSTLISLGESCFDGMDSLAKVTVPGSVQQVPMNMFMFSYGLRQVTLSEGIREIKNYAFLGCENLGSITIPTSVTNIEEYAFSGCTSLTNIHYAGTEEQWNAISIAEDGNDALRSAEVHYGSTGPFLPAPILSVAPSTRRQDMQVTVTGVENAESIDITLYTVSEDSPDGDWVHSISAKNGETAIIPGWCTDASNYKITAVASARQTGENGRPVWVSGDQAVLYVNLSDPENEITPPDNMAFSKTEGYSGEITMTVEGAEAIAFDAYPEGFGGGRPYTYTLGDHVTLEAVGGQFGKYNIWCWARFNDLWYYIGEGEVTLIPSGALDVPTISMNGQELRRLLDPQTVALTDPISVAVSCPDSYMIEYYVDKVVGSFDLDLVSFCADGSYSTAKSEYELDGYDDNEYDESIEYHHYSDGPSETFDMPTANLPAGDYRVLVVATSSDSGIKYSQYVTWVHFAPTSGTCGDNVTWAFNDGTLTISGSGDMYDYDWGNIWPWHDIDEDIHSVVIESGVTSIGSSAFNSCNNMTGITIPDSVTSIGDSSLSGCSGLTSLVIPNSVTSIDNFAFTSCTKLSNITLSNNITSISIGAFLQCTSLTDIVIPGSVETISVSAFYDCTGLTNVTISDGVTTISGNAFNNCSSLMDINIPDSVTHIGNNAFQNCSSLTSITIAHGVQTIDKSAFSGCTSLTDIYYAGTEEQWNAITIAEEGNEALANAAIFYNSHPDSQLPAPVISNVTTGGTIGRDVSFDYNCAKGTGRVGLGVHFVDDSGRLEYLETIGLNDYNDGGTYGGTIILRGYHFQKPGTYRISMQAYTWYHGEEPSETIADSDKTVYEFTLENADQPTISVSLSATNSYYSYGAAELNELSYSISGVDSVAWAWQVNSEYNDREDGLSLCGGYTSSDRLDIDVGRNEYTFYGRVNGVWSKPVTKIITVAPAGVLDAPIVTYQGQTVGETLVLASMDDLAFDLYCENATELIAEVRKEDGTRWGEWITNYYTEGDTGFFDLTGDLQEPGTYYIQLHGSPESGIGWEYEERTITLYIAGEDGIFASGSCGENAAWTLDLNGLLTISGTGEMGDWEEGAPWDRFMGSITSVSISEGITSIGFGAFYECTGLTGTFTIPAGVTRVASDAFDGCTGLTGIIIPDSVTYFGFGAFRDCTNLEQLVIPPYLTDIGEQAFYGCYKLASLSIPATVTRIGFEAFAGTAITEITLPEDAVIDFTGLFDGCTELRRVVFPKSFSGSFSNVAFYGCSSLTEVIIPENNNDYRTVDGVVYNKSATELLFCPAGLTQAVIPNTVTTIGWCAFDDCSKLTSITIPASVTTIEDSAFSGCTSLTDIYYAGTETQWNAISIGDNNDSLTSAQLHYNCIPTLPAPELISRTPITTIGQDLEATFRFSDNTVMPYIELYYVNEDGSLDSPSLVWAETDELTALGLVMDTPGTYQIRARAYAHRLSDPEPETLKDSEYTIVEFELTGTELPDCPAVQLSHTELNYGEIPESVTYTIPGAEAVTFQWHADNLVTGDDEGGMNAPTSYDEGSTGTIDAGWYLDRAAYHRFTFWARINGVWSKASPEYTITVNPIGYLADPIISYNGKTIDEELTIMPGESPIFTVECEHAEFFMCTVNQVLEDGSKEWLAQPDSEIGVIDLSGVDLHEGTYTLSFWVMCDGWVSPAWKEITLHVPSPDACGPNLTWALNDGTLTISGTGDMFDCDWNTGAPWKDASADIHTVVVESGVTGIGASAFYECGNLTSVTLPEGLTHIGSSAFEACTSLTSITIPNGMTSIGGLAFFRCSALASVALPDGLVSIGDVAFSDTSLRNVTIPAGIQTKTWTFYFLSDEEPCEILVKLELPASVTAVDGSFWHTNLPAVAPDFRVPSGLQTIESEAFSGISATFVWLSDNVTSIGSKAFANCPNLKYVRIPEDCSYIAPDAFPKNTVLLIPEFISNIEDFVEFAETNGYIIIEAYKGYGNG